ncbi:hypothetical protein F2P81_024998 [Scophthalmus maximus]|uniref:Uncharacterized protein n=1 Tax=Scophthalmus maximus TaxID=52904 RepID=A0A6A4RRT7_SCOMX|nr:hypothetical protein F2P81_024998 [Scophthalmus maximus]
MGGKGKRRKDEAQAHKRCDTKEEKKTPGPASLDTDQIIGGADVNNAASHSAARRSRSRSVGGGGGSSASRRAVGAQSALGSRQCANAEEVRHLGGCVVSSGCAAASAVAGKRCLFTMCLFTSPSRAFSSALGGQTAALKRIPPINTPLPKERQPDKLGLRGQFQPTVNVAAMPRTSSYVTKQFIFLCICGANCRIFDDLAIRRARGRQRRNDNLVGLPLVYIQRVHL